jgi:hypothetical protein
MNVYQRPLFRQMGGPVAPGMAAQEAMMPQAAGMPPAAAAQDPMAMAQQVQDMAAQQTQGIGEQYAQATLMNIDQAETPEQIINALRGNEVPLEQRYAELAQFVGEADAQRTPESVLALVQPTIMMTEQGAMDSGIGELMQGLTGEIEMETADGAPTAMGQGVGSLMMAGANAAPGMGVGQQPVANFRQGGVVQRFQDGGEASRLQQLYSEMLPTYQSILGDGGEQRRLTQAQILFDIADRAGAFAAGVDPRTGQSIARLSPAAQLAAATSGLGGQIGERLGSQEEQDRALRLAALQAAQGEFSAERAAARAAGSRDRALGTLYDVYDREGNLVQQGVPIADRAEYDAIISAVGDGARITPARTDTVSFDTTTLYGPDGSAVTIDTSTAAGVIRARDLIDNGGFTTVAPTAAGFDTTTLYGPDGTPVTINTGTPEGQARADDLMDNEGFTTVAPTAAGFDTTTLYGPDGTPVTINTGTPEGQARADDLIDNGGFTTVAPTAAGFDTTTLYGPDGTPVTIDTSTAAGVTRARDLMDNEGFTTVAPTGEIGKQYEAVDAQGNVLARAFLADKAAFDKFVADYPGATIREALTQELGDEVLLYNPNDLNAPPVRERVGTPTYNMSRNAGLRTLEEIEALRNLTTTEAPATLIERQQATITNQNTLDNLESLSPQELGLFAANAAAYIQETVGPAGVSSRLPLPPNTQEAMRRAYALGIDFPGIDPTFFGAPLRPEEMQSMGLALLDINNVDLGAATGFVSTLARSINFLGEQVAEVAGGEGTVFTQTAEASGALNALAQATRRFYLEGRTLAREFENLEREIPTFSGFLTDANARRTLGRQRALLEGELERVMDVIENPRQYTNVDISKARQMQVYASQLLATYDQFLQAYQGANRSGTAPTFEEIMGNPDYLLND